MENATMENGKFRIYIKDLKFNVIIGILEKERINPQEVRVDIEIEYFDKSKFVDYAKVCEIVKTLMKNRKYSLLEDALEEITDEIKKEFNNITEIKMLIKKPQILKNALVGVEILRKY